MTQKNLNLNVPRQFKSGPSLHAHQCLVPPCPSQNDSTLLKSHCHGALVPHIAPQSRPHIPKWWSPIWGTIPLPWWSSYRRGWWTQWCWFCGNIYHIYNTDHFYPDLWIEDPDLDTVVQLSTWNWHGNLCNCFVFEISSNKLVILNIMNLGSLKR